MIALTSTDFGKWMIFDGWWMIIPMIFLVLFTEIALICVAPLRRKVPINYILLLLFTLGESWLVAQICCEYAF